MKSAIQMTECTSTTHTITAYGDVAGGVDLVGDKWVARVYIAQHDVSVRGVVESPEAMLADIRARVASAITARDAFEIRTFCN